MCPSRDVLRRWHGSRAAWQLASSSLPPKPNALTWSTARAARRRPPRHQPVCHPYKAIRQAGRVRSAATSGASRLGRRHGRSLTGSRSAADPSSGTGYHPMDPGIPLNGPTTQPVTQRRRSRRVAGGPARRRHGRSRRGLPGPGPRWRRHSAAWPDSCYDDDGPRSSSGRSDTDYRAPGLRSGSSWATWLPAGWIVDGSMVA